VQKVQKGSKKPTPKPSAAVVPSTPIADDDFAPKRAVEKQLKRRRLIHECMLLGINDNPGILGYLKANQVVISEKTMIKDRQAVRAEFKAGYERKADELRSDILAELDGIAYQLQTIASKGDAKYNERVAALASKRETLQGKAKLLGLITDKQEVRGSVTNFNVNDPTADEIAAFNEAARDAGDDGSLILEALET